LSKFDAASAVLSAPGKVAVKSSGAGFPLRTADAIALMQNTSGHGS